MAARNHGGGQERNDHASAEADGEMGLRYSPDLREVQWGGRQGAGKEDNGMMGRGDGKVFGVSV